MSKRERNNSHWFTFGSFKGCASPGCFFKKTVWEQNRAGTMPGEGSESPEDKYCIFPLTHSSQGGQIPGDAVVGAVGEWGVTV